MVILSIPPAITARYSPALIAEEAIMTDLRLEPHTLLIVVLGVVTGKPAPSATCRAGFCPAPAWRTWPIKTSSIMVLSEFSPTFSINPLTAHIPRSTALNSENTPLYFPIGVRATAQITGVLMAAVDTIE